jgi:hypothetical protein
MDCDLYFVFAMCYRLILFYRHNNLGFDGAKILASLLNILAKLKILQIQ